MRADNEADSVITLQAFDAAGNGSEPTAVRVHVDDSVPRVTVLPFVEAIKTHVSAIMRKLDLRDRVHAVITAYDHGLVHPNA